MKGIRAYGHSWLLGVLVSAGCGPQPEPVSRRDRETANRFLEAVQTYAGTVIEHGRDRFGESATPLFVDGLNLKSYEPAKWTYDDHVWILSNLANQQDLLRTLDGLTELTGEAGYRKAATEAIRYAFDHLTTPNGLLLWGGHTCYDAGGEQWAGRRFHWLGERRSPLHELKACYPHYPLMWETDPEATRQFVRTFWRSHVRDWSKLDFDRHGKTGGKPAGAGVWDRPFEEGAPVFFRGQGRTFVNTASDLVLAGGLLDRLGDEPGALLWAKRLAGRFVAARDPETGLRGYQYSGIEEVDRAFEQFGDLFPDSRVLEATLFDPNALPAPLLAQLRLSEILGGDGDDFREWAVEDLIAIGRHAYDESRGVFKSLLTDGTDITDVPFPRDGYFGPKGTAFTSWPAEDYFLVYATASRLSEEPFLWEMARKTGRDGGLGDIGKLDGNGIDLDGETAAEDPLLLMGLIELFHKTGRRAYLDLACQVGDNILVSRFENGLFTEDPGYIFTRTSRPEPLVLLHLAATLLGRSGEIPDFFDSDPYFACELKSTDPGYTFDRKVIYTVRRD